jgi:hypothetical protein
MNPELRRNFWLELTQRRMTQMVVVLGLILLTVNVTPIGAIGDRAFEFLFYAIVVLWGTRNAAQAVVGEIRERTWDFQRLSALTPFEMTLGKLLGATSYVWFGGLICLAVIVATEFQQDPSQALSQLFYLPAVGLLSQALALFASLVAIRRRQTRTQFNVFQYQAAGLLAAYLVTRGLGGPRVREVVWWGWTIDGDEFHLASLAVFLAWALVGCYRLMRVELQVQTYPTVWLAFILFMAAYMAGLDLLPVVARSVLPNDPLSIRVILPVATLAFFTYVAVLFEPKDRVLYRWLSDMLAKGRTVAALSRLQCWMVAYAAAIISGAAVVLLGFGGISAVALLAAPMILAGLGFLTRDLGVFLFFGLAPGQKRGDMPAVITLAILYLLLPRLLGAGAVPEPSSFFFYPLPLAGWVGALFAWAEAAVIWALVLVIRGKQTAALPQV